METMSEHMRRSLKIIIDHLLAKAQHRAGLYSRQNPLTWVFDSMKNRGLRETFGSVVRVVVDVGFDMRYGTDTVRWVEINALGFESEHKKDGFTYIPSPVNPLRTLLRKLGLPKDGVFIDLGSGKGRVLLIAAQNGFQRIIGVEFSPELCEIARENVKVFLRKTQINAQLEVIETDAATFPIDGKYNVFFMYYPFGKVVLARFLANLRSSLVRFPRKIWLIYNNPVDDEVIGGFKLFSASQEFRFSGAPFPFRVYQN
jgi:SAM-dependent methyltransferase